MARNSEKAQVNKRKLLSVCENHVFSERVSLFSDWVYRNCPTNICCILYSICGIALYWVVCIGGWSYLRHVDLHLNIHVDYIIYPTIIHPLRAHASISTQTHADCGHGHTHTDTDTEQTRHMQHAYAYDRPCSIDGCRPGKMRCQEWGKRDPF